jgi:hypothetical protein
LWLLADLGGQQIADDALWFVLALLRAVAVVL